MSVPLQIAVEQGDGSKKQHDLVLGETDCLGEALFLFKKDGVWCMKNVGNRGDVRVLHSGEKKYKDMEAGEEFDVGPERFVILTCTPDQIREESVHLWEAPTAVPIVLSDEEKNRKFAENMARLKARDQLRAEEQAQMDRFWNPSPFDEDEEQALILSAILAASFDDAVNDKQDSIRKLQQGGASLSTATDKQRAELSELQEGLREMMSTRYTDLENNHSVLAQINFDQIY
jgi:hypothetical protein